MGRTLEIKLKLYFNKIIKNLKIFGLFSSENYLNFCLHQPPIKPKWPTIISTTYLLIQRLKT